MRLAFVLTTSKRLPSQAAVDAALADYPGVGPATWFGRAEHDTLTFEAGGVEVMAALMPAPVPNGEADAATEHSISGVTGQWTLPAHTSHLICMLRQGDSGLAEMVRFTRIVGALARASKAVGVYWSEGHATHHPELFIELAGSDLPLPLWVGVSLAATKKGVELLSIGMKQLGLPDLLVTAPEMNANVLEFFYDLLAHVTRRGEALPEGDTVGRSEHEHFAVTYVPSPVEPDVKVWRVQLDGGAKVAATRKRPPTAAVKTAAKQRSAARRPTARKTRKASRKPGR
ncbi:MAG: DUF4261 domain-containing protein [Myxococcota bacterium]|jgi:hypothetical protein